MCWMPCVFVATTARICHCNTSDGFTYIKGSQAA